MSETFTNLIEGWAKQQGWDLEQDWESPLEFDVDEGAISLAYQNAADEEIWLYGVLARVPEHRELEVYRVLLEANHFWSGASDATLSVNSITLEAMLAYRISLKELNVEILTALINGFSEIYRQWRNYLLQETQNACSDSVLLPEFSPNMLKV